MPVAGGAVLRNTSRLPKSVCVSSVDLGPRSRVLGGETGAYAQREEDEMFWREGREWRRWVVVWRGEGLEAWSCSRGRGAEEKFLVARKQLALPLVKERNEEESSSDRSMIVVMIVIRLCN